MKVDLQTENQIKIYVDDSKNWYKKNYLQLKVDSRKVIISFLCILCIMSLVKEMLDIKTNTIKLNFPIYVEDDADEVHHIKSLFNSDQSIEEVIARYMIERYVNLRETYNPQLLEDQNWLKLLNNINGLSSHQTFETYLNYMLPHQNPKSPILQYRFNTIVSTKIENIQMTQFSLSKPIAAKVSFNSTKCNSEYAVCTTENWIVKLQFDMSNITEKLYDNIESKPVFFFKVSSYQKYEQ